MKNIKIEELKRITNNNSKVLDWIDENISHIESTQLILNEKYLASEYCDMIKVEMIRRISEQILEEAADIRKTKSGYTLDLHFLKRRY